MVVSIDSVLMSFTRTGDEGGTLIIVSNNGAMVFGKGDVQAGGEGNGELMRSLG